MENLQQRELRIGNYIKAIYYQYEDLEENEESSEEVTVLALDPYYTMSDNTVIWVEGGKEERYHKFEPIPLTEEWLVKFGMELYDGFSSTRVLRLDKNPFDVSNLTYNPVEGLLRFSNGHSKGSSLIPYVKYVHQLQNLYFALTGKELPTNN
jgi:hypothetical protein